MGKGVVSRTGVLDFPITVAGQKTKKEKIRRGIFRTHEGGNVMWQRQGWDWRYSNHTDNAFNLDEDGDAKKEQLTLSFRDFVALLCSSTCSLRSRNEFSAPSASHCLQFSPWKFGGKSNDILLLKSSPLSHHLPVSKRSSTERGNSFLVCPMSERVRQAAMTCRVSR